MLGMAQNIFRKGDIPDSTLYEEFYTDNYRIESPLHGTPKVYKKTVMK